MYAAKAVGAMVAVVASRSFGNYFPSAVFAFEYFVAGMGFVISFFKRCSLIFSVHKSPPVNSL
jgi:hypothetical protein